MVANVLNLIIIIKLKRVKNSAILLLFLCSSVLQACTMRSPAPANMQTPTTTPIPSSLQHLETAYFASGCFWCVEAIFESLKGVEEVVSGYAGGQTANPTYKQVVSGRTGHAETIQVFYNPKIIGFKTLLKVFFDIQKVLLNFLNRKSILFLRMFYLHAALQHQNF